VDHPANAPGLSIVDKPSLGMHLCRVYTELCD
jgi:hypothetical protein